MLKAKGNLSMINKSHFIARTKTGIKRSDALMLSKFGDKYRIVGDDAKAFKYYKKSLLKDQDKPETFMRLAKISRRQMAMRQARNYITEAWLKKSKFVDVNDALELPGIILEIEQSFTDARKLCGISQKDVELNPQRQSLRKSLCLLKEVRSFNKTLDLYSKSFSRSTFRMLKAKGLPNFSYQYHLANLYNNVYHITDRNSRNYYRMLTWLNSKERKILYDPIKLPYRSTKQWVHPKRMWSEAFFEASLYHYQLAHELNPLKTQAALEIVKLCFNRLKDSHQKPTRKLREKFVNLGKHFSRQFLRVPSKDRNMTFVERAQKLFMSIR